MNNMIQVINNFISKDVAEELCNFIENNLNIFIYRDDRKRYMLRFGYDEELPEQAIFTMDAVSPVKDTLVSIFNKVTEHLEGDVVLTSWFLSKQVPGSKLTPHKDGCEGTNGHLKYTAMLYLNDLDNNGSIGFTDTEIEITPQMGDLIIFNSLEDEHFVSDIEQDRYSLPMWFTLDKQYAFEI
jgi:hypothetical protein